MSSRDLVSQRMAEVLGAAIVGGELKSGDPIPSEMALCQRFDASRTAVREALKILGSKRLITTRPRLGGVVAERATWSMLDVDVLRWMRGGPPDVALLHDLATLRRAIEPEAAALAAERRDPETLAALDAAVAAMALDPADALDADIAFHVALLTGSGNRFLASLAEMVASALSLSIPITNRVKQVPKADVDAHRAIAAAIRAGAVEDARRLALELIGETARLLDQSVDDKHD